MASGSFGLGRAPARGPAVTGGSGGLLICFIIIIICLFASCLFLAFARFSCSLFRLSRWLFCLFRRFCSLFVRFIIAIPVMLVFVFLLLFVAAAIVAFFCMALGGFFSGAAIFICAGAVGDFRGCGCGCGCGFPFTGDDLTGGCCTRG